MDAKYVPRDEPAIQCAWCGAEGREFVGIANALEIGYRGEKYVTGQSSETHQYFDPRCNNCGWLPQHMSTRAGRMGIGS